MTIRLGEIDFINSLPLHLSQVQQQQMGVTVTAAAPTTLNQLMLNGELDISPVSSAFFLKHQDQFALLSNLAIGAEQAIESVVLFIPKGWPSLTKDSVVGIPDTSATSIALLRYVMSQKAGILLLDHQLSNYPGGSGHLLLQQSLPVLAIGDEALQLKQAFGNKMDCIDLAQSWIELTGLPFVFAVWAVQKSLVQSNPEAVQRVQNTLENAKIAFYNSPERQREVIQTALQIRPQLPPALIEQYFTRSLSYNLDRPHQQALTLFDQVINQLDAFESHDTPTRNRSVLSV